MTEKTLSDFRKEFEDAKKEYEFWTSGNNCQPGSQRWEEVVARYSAARDAYDFALRQQSNIGTDSAIRAKSADAPRRIFVIHGRDERIRSGMFSLLRAVGLEPLEWIKAIELTRKASPYIGEILDAAFDYAQAVVVLLTPDDVAKIREDLLKPDDPPFERELTGQARPNVLFEAGMAFASHPDRTVLVEIGIIRPFTDVTGRHVVKMDNSVAKRQELGLKLRTAGCAVNFEGQDWHTVGDLGPPAVGIVVPVARGDLPGVPGAGSRLREAMRVVIAPVSRNRSEGEFQLEKVDEMGVLIRLPGGEGVRIPKLDYTETWDDASLKPKLMLTRKYFQGYFRGHEHAPEYFLPR